MKEKVLGHPQTGDGQEKNLLLAIDLILQVW